MISKDVSKTNIPFTKHNCWKIQPMVWVSLRCVCPWWRLLISRLYAFAPKLHAAAISRWFASARFFGWKSFKYKHKPDVKCLQYKCILHFSVFILSPFFCLKASVAAIGSPLIYLACYSLSHWPAAVSIVVESSTVPNLWLKNTTDKYLPCYLARFVPLQWLIGD